MGNHSKSVRYKCKSLAPPTGETYLMQPAWFLLQTFNYNQMQIVHKIRVCAENCQTCVNYNIMIIT